METKNKTWTKYYKEYKEMRITVKEIAEIENLSIGTVYNRLVQIGDLNSRIRIDRNALYNDWNKGMTISELCRKYNCTMTYIRTVIRNKEDNR